MGDCDDALHELYTFLDGELTAENRARILRHLDACHPCLEAFDFEAELRMVIATKCRDAAPPGLLDRIRARLASEAGGPADVAPA